MDYEDLNLLGNDIRNRYEQIKLNNYNYNYNDNANIIDIIRNDFICLENCIIDTTYNNHEITEKKKLLIIIACHTSKGRYHVLEENIKYFDLFDIIIINSKEYENKYNYNLSTNIKEIFFIENNPLFDFGKWKYVLENYNYNDYKKIVFTNDSIILTHNINNYLKNAFFYEYDLYGFNDSSQCKYHYQSYLFTIKTQKINIFLNMINEKSHLINNYWDLIHHYELNGLYYAYENKKCYLTISHVINGSNLQYEMDEIYEKLLNNNIYPIIKVKRILMDSIPEFILNRINKNILNEITKEELVDIKNAKIGLIYAYYERNGEQRNQTNLSFFIKHGLCNNEWQKRDITTLLIINGNQCEVIIPNIPNLIVLKDDGDSDFGAWYKGINYFEEINNKKIYEIFDYLCLMNASCIGPLIETDKNIHWIDYFYEKMKKERSIACSPCISFLPETDLGGIGPRLVPIITLIKIDKKIIDLLLNTQITLKSPTSIVEYPNEYNTVIGLKKTKIDAILSGEYGLSRILLDNGYNLSSLLYDDIDYRDKRNWTINNYLQPDRYKSYNGNDLPINKVIFIKNTWRHDNCRCSLPVNIEETNKIIYKLMNLKKIEYTNLDYETLKIENKGINLNDNRYSWNNKKEFYELYGEAEEFIIFQHCKKNKCLALYHHYDSDNIIKDYVINSIKSLIEVGYTVIFITTSNSININLPIEIIYYENNGVGSEFLNYRDILIKNIDIFQKKYEWIFFINDSVILPINGINNFKKTINNMRSTSDIWSHWESNEIKYHAIGTLIEFNIKVIPSLINFLNEKLNKTNYTKEYFIYEVEVCIIEYLISLGFKYNSVIKLNTLNIPSNTLCPIFNPIIINQWINREETFAIKWKYMLNYINNNDNQIFNYLVRYLHFGSNGIMGNPQKSGVFGDPSIYL